MGLKTLDVTPLSVTALTPVSKDVSMKAFQVSRTDTTASVKLVLPGDATITDLKIIGAASNAATTATLSVGSSSTATEYINGQDVKTAGGMIRPTTTFSSTNLPNLESAPVSGDVVIYAKYAETGTASSAGGPWTVLVEYVR